MQEQVRPDRLVEYLCTVGLSSPLTPLSFPPWLQRKAELDSIPDHHIPVMERTEFEAVMERYSRTVQRSGA